MIRKIIATVMAVLGCAAFSVGCAPNQSSTSPSAFTDSAASPGTPGAASGTARHSQTPAASGASATPMPVSEGSGLPWFFLEWTNRLELLASSDMADRSEILDGLASLIEQAQDWRRHKVGDTVTIELPSQNIVVTAQGSEDEIQSASVECSIASPADGQIITPSLLLYTLSSGALAEVLSGESEGGMETVSEAVSALLGGKSKDGIVTSNPVRFGYAEFSVSVDTASRRLTLTGTPTQQAG